jgi:hypothetical protein
MDIDDFRHGLSHPATQALVKEVSQLPFEEVITMLEAITRALIRRQEGLKCETSGQRPVLVNQAVIYLIEASNILRHSEVRTGYNRKMINRYLQQLSV